MTNPLHAYRHLRRSRYYRVTRCAMMLGGAAGDLATMGAARAQLDTSPLARAVAQGGVASRADWATACGQRACLPPATLAGRPQAQAAGSAPTLAPRVSITAAMAQSSPRRSGTVSYAHAGQVSATSCALDGQPVSCSPTRARLHDLGRGAHTLTVTVQGPGGRTSATDTFTTLAPPPPPAPVAAGCATATGAPLVVELDASASRAAAGQRIVSYQWAENGKPLAGGELTRHRFRLPGYYDLQLWVTDGGGQSAVANVAVAVPAPANADTARARSSHT